MRHAVGCQRRDGCKSILGSRPGINGKRASGIAATEPPSLTSSNHPTWPFEEGSALRGITGTLALLLVVGYAASTVELPRAWSDASPAVQKPADGWRRTANGWERQRSWRQSSETAFEPPAAWRIHPFTVAALQLLISLFALVSCETPSTRHLKSDGCSSFGPARVGPAR